MDSFSNKRYYEEDHPSAETTRYLIIMQGQVHPLIEAIHRLEQRDPETLQQLFQQYGSELLD
ncbi:hypothetical protein HUB94_28070 (plasmid) [Paenibacillus cellulosilyticus]|uniref:hypothetical protein n=1 Tax=Paenibacillus cellulosilyticus TaxID=375489 RepID=UPI0011B42B55|nr:hypothetical protein [Paenibacillus cellulosilyticus]QKS48138.1 hypothetical protein HUB94_28070 [Paenibacillus cellulosilyticus]